MRQVSRGLDRIEVAFDEPNLVANAGLLLVSTLVVRLGLEALINSTPAADRPCGRCTARSQGAEPRARDRGGSKPHRPCRAAPCRGDKSRAFPQGDGTFHARHIPSLLYFRPCPSARPGDRRDLAASVGTRGRAKGPSRPRRRLDDLSGRREQQARRQLWLHQGPRLPPAACDPGRYRRGAPCPHAQRLGQHRPWGEALCRRARRTVPAGRGDRRDRAEGRLGVLVQRHDQDPRTSRCFLHDGGANGKQGNRNGDHRDQRGRLGRYRLHRRRHRRGGRDHLQGKAPYRAPHPARRSPREALARLAALWLPHRLGRRLPSSSTPSTGTTPE